MRKIILTDSRLVSSCVPLDKSDRETAARADLQASFQSLQDFCKYSRFANVGSDRMVRKAS